MQRGVRMAIRRGTALVAMSTAAALVLGACGGGGGTTAATSQPASSSPSVPPVTTPAPALTSLATAAAWVDIGTQAKLTPDKAAPEQFTDPSAQRVQQISALITGLDFQGLAILTYTRAKADAAHPTYGSYIVKVVVFGSAADAQTFRDADVKEVTDAGALKQVDTYMDGVALDDNEGHINLMFTIGNVAVDIRIGVAENNPGDGVKEIKTFGDYVVANSTK